MSKYEWERGEIVIPSKEWAGFKKALRAAFNKIQTQAFADAKRIYEGLMAKAKGRRKVDRQEWEDWFDALATKRVWDRYTGYRGPGAPIQSYDAIRSVLQIPRLLYPSNLEGEKITRPVRPKKKDFPLANGKTRHFDSDDGMVILGDDKSRTVVWDVGENNRACDHARSHPMGQAFFALLDKVRWTRGSGGKIIGNDEYNRDSDYEGGGGNYVTAEYGPEKKRALPPLPRGFF
jgi:hypothetical protein